MLIIYTVIGNIKNSDESVYRMQVDLFAKCCEDNYLDMNVQNLKEMVLDFKKPQTTVRAL